MKIRSHATTVLFTAALSSCTGSEAILGVHEPPDSGEPPVIVEESRSVGEVRRVALSGVGVLYIRQGGLTELRVRSQEVALAHLATTVEGDELSIGFDGSFTLGSKLVLECFLTVPTLDALRAEGLWKVEASDLQAGPLAMTLDGIVEVDLANLSATRLTLIHSGAGDVTASGSAGDVVVELSGHGSFHGGDLLSERAEATLRSAASATVAARDSLAAHIEGRGHLYYFGDPLVIRTGDGSGRVVRLGT
jgi:hypothetical protein